MYINPLTDAGRTEVNQALKKYGITIAQMQADIRDSVTRAMLEMVGDGECARA